MSCFEKCDVCDGKGYKLKTVSGFYKEKVIKEPCYKCKGTGKVEGCDWRDLEIVQEKRGLFYRGHIQSFYICKKCGKNNGWWDPN